MRVERIATLPASRTPGNPPALVALERSVEVAWVGDTSRDHIALTTVDPATLEARSPFTIPTGARAYALTFAASDGDPWLAWLETSSRDH